MAIDWLRFIPDPAGSGASKKARHREVSGFELNQDLAQGLLAVGNGQAACGFSVV
jgi:hypothetical protein